MTGLKVKKTNTYTLVKYKVNMKTNGQTKILTVIGPASAKHNCIKPTIKAACLQMSQNISRKSNSEI
jgi:hypothetical protein